MRVVWSVVVGAVLCLVAGPAGAEELRLLAAGSLREVMTELTASFTARFGVPVRADFGPSGLLRERIEGGERADLFASADMGHPAALHAAGRSGPVVMFTRNSFCALARASVGLTRESFLDRLLDPGVRLGTSTPRADPSGDYTWMLFRRADGIRPGSFAQLDRKAQQVVGGPQNSALVDGRSPVAVALERGLVDVYLGYCTSVETVHRQVAGLVVVPVPDALQVGPEYGLTILKGAQPGAVDLALYILSPDGQALLAKHGFAPVGLPAR